MSTSKNRIWARYLLIPIATWIASGFIAEGLFRLNGDRTTEDKRGLYTAFDNGSFKHLPDMDVRSRWASGPFSVHTDGLGLRCDSARKHAVQRDAFLDILFIGDSQGFGNGVNYEDTIAGGVAELAVTRGLKVANASVGGHCLRNQLELVRWLHDKEGLRAARYFILLTPMMLSACDCFTQASVGRDGRLYDRPKTLPELAVIWLKTHAVIYARVRDAVRNLGFGVDPSGAVPFVFQVYDSSSDRERAAQKAEGCLADFQVLAGRNGASLSLVYVPLTIELDFSPIMDAGAARGLRLDPDLPSSVCRSVATKLGLPLYSLRPALEEVHASGRRLHLRGDFHYDSYTSRTCAQDLWRDIDRSIDLGTERPR